MGWAIGGLGIFVVLLLAAGATVAICRRYSVGWQCGPRDVWIICEEWRRKLAWLWAPREEKVGLVKAQHPTAQAVPGLYRQSSGTSSQYILHSDSDLRLDAQGAFTRFEAVDRDLHPPSGLLLAQHQTQTQSQPQSAIPPQPLRPAPQPHQNNNNNNIVQPQQQQQQQQPPLRSTARPRPAPLRPPTSVDYLRLKECDPSPLTPPPPPPPAPGKFPNRGIFLFQGLQQQLDSPSPPPLPPPPPPLSYSGLRRTSPAMLFNIQAAGMGHSPFDGARLGGGYHHQDSLEETRKIRYSVQGAAISEQLFDPKDPELGSDTSPPYGSYDIIHETRGNYESIYDTQDPFMHRVPSTRNLQDLERITRYIQSLPDAPLPPSPGQQNSGFFDDVDDGERSEEAASPAAPPPPAPPDNSDQQKDSPEPTTGEKIFKALRAVTSQSYIDASEFYNSILSSAQHVQKLNFSSSSSLNESKMLEEQQQNSLSPFAAYTQNDLPPRRAADLYNPELNQEAQRTAQQVYNSLQDPPASPLLVKDSSVQQPYSYHSDPSFTRTSEDIYKSLEHSRRQSVQDRLNGFQELFDFEAAATASETARRLSSSSQELLNALEEVQMKRRLSQLFQECLQSEAEEHQQQQQQQQVLNELTNGNISRRSSLGPEPEPPPIVYGSSPFDDVANLQRAVSFESVCSDTSVVLNDLETGTDDAPIVGHICIGLEHDRLSSHTGEPDLIVNVIEAKDLALADGRSAMNTFVRVFLLPDRQTYVQSRLCKGTKTPSYQEKFYFPLEEGPVRRTLLVEVFSFEFSDDCESGEACLVGEAMLKLDPAWGPATIWLALTNSALSVPQLGELMFSISYLPTAERLTLVVVKARNLKGAQETPGDFFVKVYLLQNGKKLHKKRTSIKRGEKSPIFNEAIIFNVPSHSLASVQLRLTVAEVSGDMSTNAKAYSVGHVLVGANTTGQSLMHWRQMVAVPRKPACMWHRLRKYY